MGEKNIKILFFGTSDFAKEILSSLIDNNYQILGVITQRDKKVGREQTLQASAVKELAASKNIPVFQPQKLDDEAVGEINKLNPDLIITIAYGKIIPKAILEIPRYKGINIHPSLLPKFRGPSPIQNAILQGEKETGITIMLMDDKMDHGSILSQTKIKIDPDETTDMLTKKIIPLSSKLLLETIPDWIQGKIKPIEQDDSAATYCQLIEREDGHIFWNEEAEIINNKFRAFQPWPGVFSIWKNGNHLLRIKLNKIKIGKTGEEGNEIGKVFKSGDGKIGVGTARGAIILEEVQLEGKNPISIKDFINGYPDFIGSILK